jgi:hypothetical protein
MFRRRTLTTANVVAILAFGGFFATIFQASLFMQQVLQYSALRTGVAYLAIAGVAVIVAAGIAARVVSRLGAGTALVIGQTVAAGGMLLLALARADEVLAQLGGEAGGAAAQGIALAEGFQRGALVVAAINLVAALAAGLLLRPAERAAERAAVEAATATSTTETSAELVA